MGHPSGQLTITITDKGKPVANMPVHEKVASKTTVNGTPANDKSVTATKAVQTNSAGQVKDDIGRQLPTTQPASSGLVSAVKADQTGNAVVSQSTQTLTFPAENGDACSVTYQRTLSNVDGKGNINQKSDSSGSNYSLSVSTEKPKVKEQK